MSPPKNPKKQGTPRRWQRLATLAGVVVLVIAFGVLLSVIKRSDSSNSDGVIRGLPRTPDYHSLLVSPTDPRRIVLGTHYGLFDSSDGGASWHRTGFGGAMR